MRLHKPTLRAQDWKLESTSACNGVCSPVADWRPLALLGCLMLQCSILLALWISCLSSALTEGLQTTAAEERICVISHAASRGARIPREAVGYSDWWADGVSCVIPKALQSA